MIARLLLLLLLVAGCTPEVATTPSPSPSPSPAPVTESPSSEPEPTPIIVEGTEQPFPANTEVDSEEGSGEPLVVTDVRAAVQAGFDRVVVELDGSGTPGWSVGYVDEPRSQGDGGLVDVDGEAHLQAYLTNVTYPTGDTGPTGTVTAPGTLAIMEVALGGVFEGTYDAFIGVREQVPFRVYGLESPARVVIEVVHPR